MCCVSFKQLKWSHKYVRKELGGEFLERAEKEIRETPEVKSEALAALRKLVQDERDLIFPADEEEHLLKFLRPCKFYPDSSFKLMKRFYRFKQKHPKYSENLTPSAMKYAISHGIATFLPNRDKGGCRIMIVQIGTRWNPKEVKLIDLFRCIMMFIEIAMAEPLTQLSGVQVIFDMKDLTMSQVCQFGPSFAAHLLEWVQECIPLRLKGIHIVNEPRIFNLLFAIFKPFMHDKLRKRIIFHGTTRDKLVESFGIEYIPNSYGGNADVPEISGQLLAELMCYYEDDFIKASTIGYIKEKVIS
ncbi:uncharacterized protein CBL_03208 [Carabus blaptoides fortunei]